MNFLSVTGSFNHLLCVVKWNTTVTVSTTSLGETRSGEYDSNRHTA